MDKAFQTNTYTESVSLPTENGLLQEKGVYYMKGIWHKLSAFFVQFVSTFCAMFSTSAVSGSITIHPTATGNHSTMTSGSSNTTSGPLNATTSSSSSNFSATISTVMPSPSASSVAPGQTNSVQVRWKPNSKHLSLNTDSVTKLVNLCSEV